MNIELFGCLLWKNSNGGEGGEVMRKRQKEVGEQMGEVLALEKKRRREIDLKGIPRESSENSKCDREVHVLQKQHLYVYYFHILTSFLLFAFYSKMFCILPEIRNVQEEDL